MQLITNKTIRLLSRSGFVLIFLLMVGSFAMAALSAAGNVKEQAWNEMFGLLFLAVLGIAVYYLALSLFGWMMLKRKASVSSV
jgi:hypothetical protein